MNRNIGVFVKQLFCMHKWKYTGDHNNNPAINLFTCTKCKKEGVWL